ncbi:unnamed protein product, partial [Litomosoides sigmodontis]
MADDIELLIILFCRTVLFICC